jgi:hypothetical protein
MDMKEEGLFVEEEGNRVKDEVKREPVREAMTQHSNRALKIDLASVQPPLAQAPQHEQVILLIPHQ